MSTLKIFGNIHNILEGNVCSSNIKPVENAHFAFALGGSTFSDQHCIGETLIADGVPHVSWVKNNTLINRSGNGITSPFLMGLDVSQSSDVVIHQTSQITLGSLYDSLSLKYPIGFAVVGSFEMRQCITTYLKKAPIYGENINEHREKYWADVEQNCDVYVCLFGVVIPPAAKNDPLKNKWLDRAFYTNPAEKVSRPYDSHTHVAFVDRLSDSQLQNWGSLKFSGPVRHLISESLILTGHFRLFPIHQVIAES